MERSMSQKSEHSHMVASELTHLLADTYILYLKTQNFHWNVTGPLFPALHTMFEAQYTDLQEAVDTIAERIRSLGEHAPGSFAEFQKLSSLKEESGTLTAENMINKLLHDHEVISHQLLHIFEKAEEANDQATMDLLTERLRAHEKTAWMLRSSIQ
jgi:starvation-inducible DNA-binding protein